MWRERSSRPSSASAGFTLIELLVASAIGTLVMGAVVNTLLSTTRYRREIETRLEVQQGVKAAMDALSRDVRLAGACLPTVGGFVALAGVDGTGGVTTRDEITARIGLLDGAGACVVSTLRNDAAAGVTVLDVESATGFAVGTSVYVAAPNGTGEFARIAAVDDLAGIPSADTIRLETPLANAYVTVSGVYAVEERRYAVANGIAPGRSLLTLSIDGAEPQPMALGIDTLDVRYTLRQACPACTTVALPANPTEWRLVTDVQLEIGGKLPSGIDPSRFYGVRERARVKPRNLLPPSA